MTRRHPGTAVITGVGVLTPTGIGAEAHWEAGLRRHRGIAPLPPGPGPRVGGRIPEFDPSAYVDGRVLVQTDRWTQLACAAAALALDDAGLDPARDDPLTLAVVTASSQGGNAFGQKEIQALWSQGPRAVSAYQSIGWFYAASSGQISIRHQMKGACGVLVADDAGGIDALARARRLLRRGTTAALVGGTEAPLSPYALACQPHLNRAADPTTAYRPYADDAGGPVAGEGGAMLVAEAGDLARLRSATVYAEILGTAAGHDAHDPTRPAPDCGAYADTIALALRRAGCGAADIDVVFADAAGDPERDRREVEALIRLFGVRGVPVAVPKTMTGRLGSGGAVVDLAWATLALRHRTIPPSVHLDDVAPGHRLDLVTTARPAPRLRTALVLARGAGGFNAAAVLRRPTADPGPGCPAGRDGPATRVR